MSEVEIGVAVALGIGLAAATGLRIFLPMLIASLAAHAGYLPLDGGFAWLASTPATIMLAVAAAVEIAAYYVPGLDNLLDTLATPAAFVAGTVVSAAAMTELPPMLQWTTAIIAGGGIAGITQGATAALRAKSAVLTGGVGNPAVSTAELGGALILSLLAIAAPIVALALVVVLVTYALRTVRRLLGRGRAP